jgi:hypothetical protein
MQSSFSTSMTAATLKRWGTEHGVALRLLYQAAPQLMNGPTMNSSNDRMPLQRKKAEQKSRTIRKGNLSRIRPPVRWGINE